MKIEKEIEKEIEMARAKVDALLEAAKARITEGTDPTPLLGEALETSREGLMPEMTCDSWECHVFERIVSLAPAKAEADAILLFEKALETAQGIKCSGCRDTALFGTIKEMAVVGMDSGSVPISEKVKEKARMIMGDGWESSLLEHIARVQAGRGLFKEALETACRIESAHCRAEALSSIASELAKAGMFREALETACRIEDATSRAHALLHSASKLAKSGMDVRPFFWHAADAASRIRDDDVRDYVIHDLASQQADAGMFREAIETACKLDSWDGARHTLSGILSKQIKAGMFREATDAAREVGNDWIRAWLFIDLASEHARAGMDAKPLLVEAAGAARKIYHAEDRESMLRHVEYAQEKAGMDAKPLLVEAADAARAIRDDKERASRLISIALSQAEAGMDAGPLLKEAADAARRICDYKQRVEMLTHIASRRTEAGMDCEHLLCEALRDAGSISGDRDRADAFKSIAWKLVDAVRLRKAREGEFQKPDFAKKLTPQPAEGQKMKRGS